MKKRSTWIAIGLLLLLAGGGGWWLSRRGGAGRAGAGDEAGGTPTTPGETAAALARKRAARGGKQDRTPAALSGVVRDARTAAPIAGAVVLVSWQGLVGDPEARAGEAPLPLTARTGQGGEFSLARVPPGRYTLSASAPGYLPGELLGLVVAAGVPQSGLELRLSTGGSSLTGTVSDVGGGPVAEAVVSAMRRDGSLLGTDRAPFATMTDASGAYRLDLADGVYDVTVEHVDYVMGHDDVELRGGPRTLDFVLTPGGSIQGVVLTRGDRKPVAGAIVTASGGKSTGRDLGFAELAEFLGWSSVMTDEQGRFTIRGLGSGAVELKAVARHARSKEPTVVELGIAEPRVDVEVLVDAAFTISGFVVKSGETQEGVPGVLVTGIQTKGGFTPTYVDETDEDGYFEILGVEPGRFAMAAGKDGLLPSVMQTMVTVDDHDVTDVLITLDVGTTLRGHVEPRGPATISLEMDEKDLGLTTMFSAVGAALVHGRADERGEFELRAVPRGKFTLAARRDDGLRGELAVVVKDDQDGLVIKLTPRASIAGQVVDEHGKPVEGATIDLYAMGRGDGRIDFGEFQRGDVHSGADGRFVARGLDAGKYGVSVKIGGDSLGWAPGFTPPGAIELGEAEQKTGLRLEVEARDGVIRGRVIGADGAPVADAWVSARYLGTMSRGMPVPADPEPEGGGGGGVRVEVKSADDDAPESEPWGGGQTPPVLTDDGGRFVLKGLRTGKYDVTGEAGGARGFKRGVDTGEDVTLKLRPLGGLAGQVTVGGKPITDYRLQVEGPNRREQRVMDEEGRYSLSRLDAGDYQVSVTCDQGAVKKPAKITPGETATLDLAIEPWGEVSGTIVDALTGKPLSGLNVMAYSHELGDPGDQAMGLLTGGGPKTDSNGHFQVGKLGPGPGTLVAFDSLLGGFQPIAMQEFKLGVGERKDLGTIRGLTSKEVDRDERGTLGLYAGERPASEDQPPDGRVWVLSVDAAGPAAMAGVAVDDEVIAIDGHPVAELGANAARELLSQQRVKKGQVVKLTLKRGAQTVEATVVAAPLPPDP